MPTMDGSFSISSCSLYGHSWVIKHPTPSILGQSVVNSNIDDNRYLQQCLILASEDEHKIITNRKMDDESVYNEWWKQPNKYKVFEV